MARGSTLPIWDNEELRAVMPANPGSTTSASVDPVGVRRSRHAVVNDTLTITVHLKRTHSVMLEQNSPYEMVSAYGKLLHDTKHADVVLRTSDGHERRAHKVCG